MPAQLALTIPEARAERDAGMRLSADHGEAVEPGWGASALRMLADFARAMPRDATWTSEDFRAHLAAISFPVPVPKALGQVFRRAAKAGVIHRVGFGVSKERHLSPCPAWRRA